MELKVMVRGPDTVHPLVVSVPDEEDPLTQLATAIAQKSEVVRFGESVFRTDLVMAVLVTQSFVEGGMRNTW
jgi:hypothetical protein